MLVVLLFISTSVMTVIILNMLIAIMSDTFNRQVAERTNRLNEVKLELLQDQISIGEIINLCRSKSSKNKYKYLIIIQENVPGA